MKHRHTHQGLASASLFVVGDFMEKLMDDDLHKIKLLEVVGSVH